jgi:hypothetical protein
MAGSAYNFWVGGVALGLYAAAWYSFEKIDRNRYQYIYDRWDYIRSSNLVVLVFFSLCYAYSGEGIATLLKHLEFYRLGEIVNPSANPLLRWEWAAIFMTFLYVPLFYLKLLLNSKKWLEGGKEWAKPLLGSGVVVALIFLAGAIYYFMTFIETSSRSDYSDYQWYVLWMVGGLTVLVIIDLLTVIATGEAQVQNMYKDIFYYGDIPLLAGMFAITLGFFVAQSQDIEAEKIMAFFGGAIALHLVSVHVVFMVIEARHKFDV